MRSLLHNYYIDYYCCRGDCYQGHAASSSGGGFAGDLIGTNLRSGLGDCPGEMELRLRMSFGEERESREWCLCTGLELGMGRMAAVGGTVRNMITGLPLRSPPLLLPPTLLLSGKVCRMGIPLVPDPLQKVAAR